MANYKIRCQTAQHRFSEFQVCMYTLQKECDTISCGAAAPHFWCGWLVWCVLCDVFVWVRLMLVCLVLVCVTGVDV